LADKLSHLLLDALGRAALAPDGLPLVGSKAAPGLFPATAPARQAAQRARDEGLLRTVAADPKGKADRDLCTTTDKGRAYLLQQTSPKQVLEDLVRAVEARQDQVAELAATARQMQASLQALRSVLEHVLPRVTAAPPPPAPAGDWLLDLRTHLVDWRHGGAAGDCPLPDLYRRLRAAHPALTIGQFHDGLRQLHEQEQIYLHPWTGPLYAMPEPACALLTGHEVAYYASERVRSQEPGVRSQFSPAGGRNGQGLVPTLA
jgi:hypothetical protein